VIAPVTQRWRARRASYRPAGEPIRTADYDVALLGEHRAPRAFVEEHHYSGSWVAARFVVGLARVGALVGVAAFSVPVNPASLDVLPCGRGAAVELGRLVLLDEVPANAESWMLARAFELLRAEHVAGVVSFSDPMARVDSAGRVVMPGHVGTIYQASNATFLGRARPDTLRLLPDGRAFCNRAAAKIRAREVGYERRVELLERHGAAALGVRDDAAAWLATWLPRLTRAVRHPGNLKYAFGLDRTTRRRLPPSLPFPKLDPRAGAAS
jgi:hypothetical protein